MTCLAFCFDRNKRLLKPADFKKVFDAPIKKIHSEHCLMFVGRGSENTPRIGLAITKKKLKHAVMRNQVKRITKEIFRLNQHEMECVDLVLIVKKNYTKDHDISPEINRIFEIVKSKYPNKS
ncbi:ribonuclease P protein component [Moraxella sp. Tifton1]|uniref:ribonuclease P protein component n=1 Tax=Moraxella oculi TaxID=2940516 RepID=UPI002012E9BF|nr:ribonuclease P protein component [Moraxella sp. Tifton1]MCL1623979.1 ribonuclease P protein component [Moraxella sp. Tifton1]